jgi:hypothetical protein
MAERYKSTNIISNNKNKKVYQTTLYPIISRTDTDIYIQATKFDRLDLITQTYFQNPSDWVIIATANGLGKGSLYVGKTMQLRIPLNITKFQNDLNSINTNR